MAAVALVAAGLVGISMADGAPAGAAGAGTNIGEAIQLTGTATGSLSSGNADRWHVVYPATVGGTVSVKVQNTTPAGNPTCDDLSFDFNDMLGAAIAGGILGPNTANDAPFSRSGSDRYFVELNSAGCNPEADHPVTYRLTFQSGGGGTAPNPASGTATPGKSIGGVGASLLGNTSYKGTITSSAVDHWYALDKKASPNPGAIRVENTTVRGSTECDTLSVALKNTHGSTLQGAILGANTAVRFSVADAGQYYLLLDDSGCPAGGTTYRIEPQPGGEWVNPPKPATGSVPPGDSIGDVGPSLLGNTAYRGKIASSAVDHWYVLDKKASPNPATVRVENTTVRGSTECDTLSVALKNTHGSTLQGAILGRNTAATFTVADAGHYYVLLDTSGCAAGGTTYRIVPQPGNQWIDPPDPLKGSISAADSMSEAGPPLRGGTSYAGTMAGGADAWYRIDKSAGTAPGTVRVENTTVRGSTECGTLFVDLKNSSGSTIDGATLGANTAATFTVSTSGRFYLLLDDGGCGTGGATYRIEPQPVEAWSSVRIVENTTDQPPGNKQFVVGQPIILEVDRLNGSVPQGPISWTITGRSSQPGSLVVGNYDVRAKTAKITYLTNTDLTRADGTVGSTSSGETPTFYAVRPGPLTVSVNTGDGNAIATLNVAAPHGSLTATSSTASCVAFGIDQPSGDFDPPFVRFGYNDACPTKPGIKFKLQVDTVPAGDSGYFALSQVVTSEYLSIDGARCTPDDWRGNTSSLPFPAGDLGSFYGPSQVAPGTLQGGALTDSPGSGLEGTQTQVRRIRFADYLMYKSNTPKSIWVPLYTLKWEVFWNVHSTNGGTWTFKLPPEAPAPSLTGTPATQLPAWSWSVGTSATC